MNSRTEWIQELPLCGREIDSAIIIVHITADRCVAMKSIYIVIKLLQSNFIILPDNISMREIYFHFANRKNKAKGGKKAKTIKRCQSLDSNPALTNLCSGQYTWSQDAELVFKTESQYAESLFKFKEFICQRKKEVWKACSQIIHCIKQYI